MKPTRFPGFLTGVLVLAVLLFPAACHRGNSTPASSAPPFSAKLIKAADSGDLENRLKAELIRRYSRDYTRYAYGGFAFPVTSPLPPVPLASQPDSSSTAGSTTDISHSETNVQEKGVDEGDLVKTDGSFLYVARGSHFFVVQATPAEQMSVVSDIDLGEPIIELHLSGATVVAITDSFVIPPVASGGAITPLACSGGTTTVAPPPSSGGGTTTVVSTTAAAASMAPAYPYVTFYQPTTRVYSFDVTNPASPALSATFEFPGTLQGSRRINSTVYLVINHTIDIPNPVSPWNYLIPGCIYDQNAYDTATRLALEENTKRINELTIDEILSTYTTTLYNSGVLASVSTSPTVSAEDVYIPEFGNGTDLSLVMSLDLSGPVPSVNSSAVLSSWCRVYMNQDSLYLSSDNNWFWIEPLVNAAMPQGNPEPRTAVHKFSVAAGKPQYRGSGVVDGWVNDRFSMGDYQGYLRIGTTRGGWWGEGISNELTVLSEDNGNLVSTGTITGIAPGERIYSMRFDRDRGYMVTFHRTDPLFTLDLSDPANPRVAGEITVSGFATYIHLLGTDNTKLLTIGQSADSTGRVTGNKLQLFDVSSLSTPTLLSSYELGQGWSDALYDPHAFLYYEPLGLLAIPYFSSGVDANGFYTYTSGLDVFDIGPASISPRGVGVITAPTVTTNYGSYFDTVDRSVVISNASGTGGTIYSLAHRSVTAAGADLLDVKKVAILPESYSYIGTLPMGGIGPSGLPTALAPSQGK